MNAGEYFVAIVLALLKQENILLAIVLALMIAGEHLLTIVLPLMNAGEYFVGYCLAISESWRILCWLLCCHY